MFLIDIEHVYNPFLLMDFRFQKCLITGRKVSQSTEFVPLFSSQMRQKFGLHNQRLTLLSGEQIAYQDLKIPVSMAAQTGGFDQLQKAMQGLFIDEHQALKWIKAEQLHQYLALIFYAMVYYDIYSLKKQGINSHFLFTDAFQARCQVLHLVVQSITKKIEFQGFNPESIFAFKLYKDDKQTPNFDLKINANTFCIALRLGSLGIAANVLDNGVQKQFYESYLEKFAYNTLHPIQFDELFSKISYKSYLMNITYDYGIQTPEQDGEPLIVALKIPDEQKDTPIFDQWHDEVYAQILHQNLKKYGFTADEIYSKTNRSVLNFLEDEQGNFIEHQP